MAADVLTVGRQLVDLCRADENLKAVETLYSESAVSIEAVEMPAEAGCPPSRIEGRDQILAKGQWWYGAHEVHGSEVKGPYPHGDQFAVYFAVEVTVKATGQRMAMDEVALYTVKNGQITEERFFYDVSECTG